MDQDHLFALFSEQQLAKLEARRRPGHQHPLLALSNRQGYVYANTNQAIRDIKRANQAWVNGITNRLLDTSDYANASSALGEIRAYGSLLLTGLRVIPEPVVAGKAVKPEFEIDAGDQPAIIEVHTRQLNKAEAQDVAKHRASFMEAVERMQSEGPSRRAYFAPARTITPFGEPKPGKAGDSVRNNAISRVAATKVTEHQRDDEKPFVLWYDFQDQLAFTLPIPGEQLSPLYSDHDGQVGSGALWHALYGAKGDPLIDMRGADYHVTGMLHHGKFLQSDGVSAVIYSLHNSTVMFEHPSPARPLSPNLRASLLKLRWFNLDRSYLNWSNRGVAKRVAIDKATVRDAAAALLRYNRAWDLSEGANEAEVIAPGGMKALITIAAALASAGVLYRVFRRWK
jgi:hypothetical protein